MSFQIRYEDRADKVIQQLRSGKKADPVKYKKVIKTIILLSEDPNYPSLKSHVYHDTEKKYSDGKEKIFTSYIENGTPGAWRILWKYGPNEGEIEIITILWLGSHY